MNTTGKECISTRPSPSNNSTGKRQRSKKERRRRTKIGLMASALIIPIFILAAPGMNKAFRDNVLSAYNQNPTEQSQIATNIEGTSVGEVKGTQENSRKPLVVIDAGHGGKDGGTHYGDLLEKNINLDIALKLGKLLQQAGIQIVYTRDTDKSVDLYERVRIANDAQATLVISIHNNYMPGYGSYKGTETLYCTPTSTKEGVLDGKKLASLVQKKLVQTLDTVDNGIIYRSDLAVLRLTKMPAVIAEIGYLSNRSDRENLSRAEFRQETAQALCDAIVEALQSVGGRK